MRTFLRAALLAVLAAAAAVPAAAQSDILLRLRSGLPAGDRFRIDSAGGVVAIGELGIGIIPASGCGYRMMWYPFKSSFRAGGTDDGGACNYWDDANQGFYSWAGGNLTIASAYATFAFGDQTVASMPYAIAFGSQSVASGYYALANGYRARCNGSYCVSIGNMSNADGTNAMSLGYQTTADANYSIAMGYRASTNGHEGAFVINDASSSDSLEASASNQFSSRYAGGYRLYTNSVKTTGVFLNAGGGSWGMFSDRNHKELFRPVDGEEVLARIRSVPVTTWRYIGEEDRTVRHMGPMAQDWHRAFGFSADTTTINSGDFDGVNFAGVKALEARTAAQQAEIESLRGQNAALRTDVEALRAANAAMEARLQRLEAAATRTP